MSQLSAMFCDIDNFCKWFAPLYVQRLLHNGHRQRVLQTALALSEIMTIIVYFHRQRHPVQEHGEGVNADSSPKGMGLRSNSGHAMAMISSPKEALLAHAAAAEGSQTSRVLHHWEAAGVYNTERGRHGACGDARKG
jgi:hypothetical protein